MPPPLPCPLQGPRYSIPYFVNPKLNYAIQGPEKRWGPVTGFDLLSKTGEWGVGIPASGCALLTGEDGEGRKGWVMGVRRM